MGLLHLIALAAVEDNCPSSSPSLTSVSATTDSLGTCLGTGWDIEWTLVVSGAIQPGQEYLWQEATNAAGDNWTFKARTQVKTLDGSDSILGTDGEGGSETHYRKVRVYVVPTGADSDEACSGPVTSSIISQAGLSCVT